MFVFSKTTKSKDTVQNRLGEKITLNQFFDEHYYPHIEITKRQPKHDWSIYNSHKHVRVMAKGNIKIFTKILVMYTR